MNVMSTKPATILVVDDDPLNRAMLSMSLGAEGLWRSTWKHWPEASSASVRKRIW
jgi:CheY-like chemotaxis protein